MYKPLKWEYGTKSLPVSAQQFRLLSKYAAEMCYSVSFLRCLPQISLEVSGMLKFE